MPPRLKKVGYANVVVGPLVALINLFIIGKSLSRLVGLGASKGIIVPLVFIAVVFCVLGIVLFLGGIGLIKEKRWGRTWSLVFAFGSFGGAFLVNIIAQVLSNLIETGAISIPGLHQRENFGIGIGIFTLYGILLIVFLMLADARAWARGGIEVAGTVPAGATAQTPAGGTSGLAIGSLVASLVPFMLLGQITGLVLGILALRKIKQSNSTIGGKGFAIAGVIISSLILVFIIGVIVLFVMDTASRK
ncbi:MAG TPA: DUF4190 domain-containing protein [Chthoniobacterales bacterium]|nr:DUF4190 domain-containing protein [Chthoniobacterales bacterium]